MQLRIYIEVTEQGDKDRWFKTAIQAFDTITDVDLSNRLMNRCDGWKIEGGCGAVFEMYGEEFKDILVNENVQEHICYSFELSY